jgi:hypothetical protein
MSTTSDFKVQIEKLVGPDDWPKWKWHILMLLHANYLEDIIDGSRNCPVLPADAKTKQTKELTEWRQDDAKAASVIACTQSKSVAELVLTCINAKDIWDKLCSRFERSSTQRLNMLIESFFQVQRDGKRILARMLLSCKNCSAKLQKLFVDLNDELAKHNENMLSERMLTGRILSTLGKEYDNFKDVWDTIPTNAQTLNLLIEKLCAIESQADKQASAEATALVAHENDKKYSNPMKVKSSKFMKSGADHARQKFPCNKCKHLGQWAAECPQKQKHAGNRISKLAAKKNTDAFLAYVMGASRASSVDADTWYCNSGATRHITPNKHYLCHIQSLPIQKQ